MHDLLENKKLLLMIAGGIVVIFIVLLIVIISILRGAGPVTLTYWGLWEPESVYSGVIADYKRIHPNVTIKYAKQSPINYRDRVVAAVSKENGPDIFKIHNSWLPTMKNSLSSVPSSVYSAVSFKSTFYPVAVSDLTVSGVPYAVPLEIDTLALYVNEDIFRRGNAGIPTVWDGTGSFREVAKRLTVRDVNGRITASGAALGTVGNTDHWQDIVSLMMIQSGVNINQESNSQQAAQALSFYTSFAKGSERTWDETMDGSTLAFASGKVAMYIGPSWRYFDFKAMNPDLNFKVAPIPQLQSQSQTLNYATYWAEAVSAKSKNQKAAWEFVKYLSSKEVMTKLYTAQSKIRTFGQPYSRVDMSGLLTSDPNVGPFISGAPTAKSSFLASFTGDGETGINSKVSKYYLDAINSVLKGTDIKTALETVSKGMSQLIK